MDSAISNMNGQSLGIVWWNVENFYHFDSAKIGNGQRSRWPKTIDAYQEKFDRVALALSALFRDVGTPAVLALGEITKRAAKDLKDRLLPTYKLISLDVKADEPTLQIAVMLARGNSDVRLIERPPLVVPDTPKGTRPMVVVDMVFRRNVVRMVVCHWQARFGKESEETRHRIGTYVSKYAYDFLKFAGEEKRNIIILGDLNEEPFGLPMDVLHAHRNKGRALARVHHADADVKRVHLYNCSWRLLGEKHAHKSAIPVNSIDVAGTYYWESEHSWHTLDHFIVSKGLLGAEPPYIEESKLAVSSLSEFIPEGLPQKFTVANKKYQGLSDHLPITAKINLGA